MPEGIPDMPVKEEKITVSAPLDKAKASTSDEMDEGKENEAGDVEMATISMLPTQKPTYKRNNNGSFMHDAVNIRIHSIKFDFPEKAVMLYKELVNYHMTNPRGGSLNPDKTILSWEPRQLMTKNIARHPTIPGIKMTQNIPGLIKFHMFMSTIFLTKSARHKKKNEGRKSTAIILWWWVLFWRALIMSQLKTQRIPRPTSTPAPAHRHTGTPVHQHTSDNPWCLISPASSVQPA